VQQGLAAVAAVVGQRVAEVAAAAQAAREEIVAVLADAVGTGLPAAEDQLRAAHADFATGLKEGLERLHAEWREAVEARLQARFEAAAGAVQGMVAALAGDARQMAADVVAAREAAEPGFADVGQRIGVLEAAVERVREAARKVGLEA
jgi:hypothetical protein